MGRNYLFLVASFGPSEHVRYGVGILSRSVKECLEFFPEWFISGVEFCVIKLIKIFCLILNTGTMYDIKKNDSV
jgi:hypothetical protein